MPKYRVLVADDNDVIRKILCAMFAGHRTLEMCEEAVNGVDAIQKARQCRPDLVIVDLSMPVMNGLDAAKTIHAEFPDLPIILFTQHAELIRKTAEHCAGISRIVSKSEGHLITKHAQEVLQVG